MTPSVAPKLHFSASMTFSTIWDVLALKGRTESPGFGAGNGRNSALHFGGWASGVGLPPAAMTQPRAEKTGKGEAKGQRNTPRPVRRVSTLAVTDCNACCPLPGDGAGTRESTHLDQTGGKQHLLLTGF